jgi:hypothetical protein
VETQLHLINIIIIIITITQQSQTQKYTPSAAGQEIRRLLQNAKLHFGFHHTLQPESRPKPRSLI